MTHARGGKYKYSGHTISFPQDITNIVTSLPCTISEVDILVFNKSITSHTSYEFFVSKTHVLVALQLKLENDPYYKDVQLNLNALSTLPENPF